LSRSTPPVRLLPVLAFTLLGFAAMGYHPGAEDDGVYLAAVKANLVSALFPHDSDFFRLQLQATVFDGWMARFVDMSHIPLAWAELLWQFLALLLILWACHSIASRLFAERRSQWAAVALVSAMLTLPVAGTALSLADQYLHPRNLATAAVLMAVARILAGKSWQAWPLLILAMLLHPIMGALGCSFCFFLMMATLEPARARAAAQVVGTYAACLVPLGWIFEPPSATWRQALETRTYYFLYKWTWYEWLGALAPLFLFWLLWRVANKRGEKTLARFSLAVFAYGAFQQIVAIAMLTPPAFIRLTPFQPMRFLHLVYFFLCLAAGGLLGKYVLEARVWRWTVFLLVANGGMFLVQRELFANTEHLELPHVHTANEWLQAFDWIRQNTPQNAYVALDPWYMRAPGEDYHSFRALAERSVLADIVKDAAVVTQVPRLGPAWQEQTAAAEGWTHFQLADFERLKSQFGVDWVVVAYPAPAGLTCPWHNGLLTVCRIP
jgi:hypothetical protein